MKYKIAIIQPMIPHYREEFYQKLSSKFDVKLYSWQDVKDAKKSGFGSVGINFDKLKGLKIGPIIIYNPFYFLFGKYDVIIMVQEMKYISHWVILLLAKLLRKEVILWGHGITAARYDEFEAHMPLSRKLMYKLADGAWFYTKKEQQLWQKLLPKLKSVALGNTVSGVSEILKVDLTSQKDELKKKYNIKTEINFIICTRFVEFSRRMDLFLKLVKKLDPKKYGFIIIGEGLLKPDFSEYSNVYNFGKVYDKEVKDELFTIADIYMQLAECGLSIIEAMAYGKAVFTLKRSKEIMQSVEYGYIEHGYNGMIFESVNDVLNYILTSNIDSIKQLGNNAQNFVRNNLTMDNMVENAINGIEQILNECPHNS